jgi:tetratricopeptide (TPR) repeat protein
MRKAWTKTFAVALCAANFSASFAVADPASWAMKRQTAAEQSNSSIWPWSKSTSSTSPQPAVVGRVQEPVSPVRHPIQYLKNATSSKGKVASSQHPTMPPAEAKADPLSLSTPTGPPTPEFFIFAAQMCERQGDIQQARGNFQRALSMWPGHVEVLRAAARMEDRLGNMPLAENLYAQAANSNPQHAGALNDLGLCLARQGKLQPSVQVLEQAIQLQPTKALYRNNAATVLVEMHQDQRALAHLAAVHAPAEANYNLGQLLVERGRPTDAVPYFQAALQQNPGMQPAQDALAKLQGNRMAAAKPRPQAINVPVSAAPTAPPATAATINAALPAVTAPPTATARVAAPAPTMAQSPAAAPLAAVVQAPTAAATPIPTQTQIATQPIPATPTPVAVQAPVHVSPAVPVAAAASQTQVVEQAPVAVPTQAVAQPQVIAQPQVATQTPTPAPAATVAPTPQYVPPVASLPTGEIVR